MGIFDFFKKNKPAGGPEEINNKSPEKKDFAYVFMITHIPGQDGKLQVSPPNEETVAKILYEGIYESQPLMKGIPLERFILVYPKEIEDAGSWAGDVNPGDLDGDDKKVSQIADRYVLPYFNIDRNLVEQHCKGRNVFYKNNSSQITCVFIADCDLRLLAPAGSAPRLLAEKQKRQTSATDVSSDSRPADKFVVIFTGYFKHIREFHEDNGISMENKVKNFIGNSDYESVKKMVDMVMGVTSSAGKVVTAIADDYVAKGVPLENIYKITETGKSYADVPWETLLTLDNDTLEIRRELALKPLADHIYNYLKTKAYSEEDINDISIYFPDQLAKSKDPKLFKNGAIGITAYVMYVELNMNDAIRREVQDAKRKEDNKHKKDVASGKRIYYAGWVEGSVPNPMFKGVGELPILGTVLSKKFGIPSGDIRTLTKKDWNPPAYGRLSEDEILNKNSAGAKRFHEQLKEAFSEYLLKQGYTQQEIDKNYRFVGIQGRGGEDGMFMIVLEINLK